MKHISYILFGLLMLSSCRMDDKFANDDYGIIGFELSVDDDVKVVSRVVTEEEAAELSGDCKIRIFQNGKLVDRYRGIPSEPIMKPIGKYSTLIIAGDSLPAAWERNYFKGVKEFDVVKGGETTVSVNCNIANTLLDIRFDEKWDELITEGTVEASVEGGSLSYVWGEESSQKTGYFSLPTHNPVIRCVFTGKSVSGRDFRNEYILNDAKEGYRYTLTYNPKEGEPVEGNEGGAFVKITVNAEPLYTVEDEKVFYQRPVISAVNGAEKIDLSQDMFVETGATISPVFTFAGSTPLGSITVESEIFTSLGFEKNVFELLTEKETLIGNGINVNVSDDNRTVTLSWGDKLNQFLNVTDAQYSVRYSVVDTYNTIGENNVPKTRDAVWNILVSDANVAAIPIPDEFKYVVWSNKVVSLYGHKLEGKEPAGSIFFRYRVKDTEEWSEPVASTFDGTYYVSSEITGLKPGTTYQYQMLEDSKPSNIICEVTTESALQLPNSGFENWSGSVPKLIYGSGESMFWDSGNHGSQKVDKNVTEPDSSVKHGGQYSAKLTSTFAEMFGFGQFAAGNIFIGKYLETQMDGLTGHGILGLGRPFTSRPIALRGYVKYISGIVDKGGDRINNGSQDQGIIYMALTDDRGTAYEYGGEYWSFIIRTKDSQFFSKENENVIAYGEQIWTESTQGEGMHEFVIRFNYDEKDDAKTRIPTRIMLVGAASRFGDYFQGSTGSTMWLDDLELIYDESELSN